MRICVVGAGAIGGLLAVRLALAGHEVSVIVRGANLAAVRDRGMKLVLGDGTEHVAHVRATDRLAEAGAQELVVLALKAHQVAAVVPDLPHLLGPDTPVVTMQNGVPWWYFQRHGGALEGRVIEAVDPGGVIARGVDVSRVIGSVVYPAAEIVAPGVVRHLEGNRFSLGELDGRETERVAAIARAFRDAGFRAPVVDDIRSEIWIKLWGNMTFNPISALTQATLASICRFPLTRALVARMMAEGQAVGEALGVTFRLAIEKRIAGAEAIGEHKTSMLQDVEAGRPLELEALVGAVIELGRAVNVPTPQTEAVYALARLLARTLEDSGARLKLAPR